MAATFIKSVGSTGSISQAGSPYQILRPVRIREGNVTDGAYADKVIVETEKTGQFILDISEGVTINSVLFAGTRAELIDALGAVFFKANGSGSAVSIDPASPIQPSLEWTGTQEEYDALTPASSTRYYVI